MKITLTTKQAQALLDAARAMLAGPEGEGDAEGVDFAALRDAANKLSKGGQR